MSKRKAPLLPESLRYLQPFANALAKLSPDELNEDVDASRLESALRKRVRGLNDQGAAAELAKDRDVLANWLQDKPEHPAHWIHGFLLSPELSEHLTQPPADTPRGPTILFETPEGWKIKTVPYRLDLKAGKVIGSIMAIEEFTFDLLQSQREQTAKHTQTRLSATNEVSDVSFGGCRGKKYLSRMTEPTQWKRVDYYLRVPGGFVAIGLGTLTGAEFDESPLEMSLHTLRLLTSR